MVAKGFIVRRVKDHVEGYFFAHINGAKINLTVCIQTGSGTHPADILR